MSRIYDIDLDRNAANFQPLTPLTFLERAAAVFPDRPAVIHGAQRFTYAELYARARRLASALAEKGIGRGDTVSVMLANTPAMIEAHYGVPMTGAVLNTLNTRLDAAILAFTLDHAEARVLITDREYSKVIKEALSLAKVKPLVIDYDDPEYHRPRRAARHHRLRGTCSKAATPPLPGRCPTTSGTRSASTTPPAPPAIPRASSITTAALICSRSATCSPATWASIPSICGRCRCSTATAGAFRGRSRSSPAPMYACARCGRRRSSTPSPGYKVTHLCGAPIVMSTLLNAVDTDKKPLPHNVEFVTAAAPPPEAVLEAMREAGFNVTHVYGLTETYGPASINEWHTEWNDLSAPDQAAKKARQGVAYPVLQGLDVIDPDTMEPVPADGHTLGEVMFRGNVVMRGYLKNKSATETAFAGGWFHSGDLGVKHPDGYIQLKDRSKDIIISGGENISSIEVEDALYKHPAVQAVAVVAKPDEKWGETPCAFVELKPGANASTTELLAWCREHLASYKCPRHLVFAELPKTSTGKIQKFKLREMAKEA